MTYQTTVLTCLMLGASIGLNLIDGRPKVRSQSRSNLKVTASVLEEWRQSVDQIASASWQELLPMWEGQESVADIHLRKLIKERMIELDPSRAWAALNHHDRPSALQAWMQRDPQAALATVVEEPAFAELLWKAAQFASVEELLMWEQHLQGPTWQEGREWVLAERLRAQASVEPDKAANAALETGMALGEVLSTWCRFDAEAALTWVTDRKGDKRRDAIKHLIPAFLNRQADPFEAADRLFPLLNESEKKRVIDWLADHGDPKHLDEAVPLVNRYVQGDMRQALNRVIFQRLADVAPWRYAELLADVKLDGLELSDVAHAMKRWVAVDADAAQQWLLALDLGEARQVGWSVYVSEISKTDLALGRVLFDQEAAVDESFEGQRAILVGFRDDHEMTEWMASVPPDEWREVLLQYLDSPYADLDLLAEVLTQSSNASDMRVDIAEAVMTRLARNAPAKAAAWTRAHVIPERMDEILSRVIATWAEDHPVAAMQWMERECGDLKNLDRCWQSLIGPLADVDPTHALKVAVKLTSGATQLQFLTFALEALACQSSTSAVEALNELTLPDSARETLAQRLIESDEFVAYLSKLD